MRREKTNEPKVTIQRNKNDAMESKECASVCPYIHAPAASSLSAQHTEPSLNTAGEREFFFGPR